MAWTVSRVVSSWIWFLSESGSNPKLPGWSAGTAGDSIAGSASDAAAACTLLMLTAEMIRFTWNMVVTTVSVGDVAPSCATRVISLAGLAQ